MFLIIGLHFVAGFAVGVLTTVAVALFYTWR
jgi:hypothetical protein